MSIVAVSMEWPPSLPDALAAGFIFVLSCVVVFLVSRYRRLHEKMVVDRLKTTTKANNDLCHYEHAIIREQQTHQLELLQQLAAIHVQNVEALRSLTTAVSVLNGLLINQQVTETLAATKEKQDVSA